MAPLHRLSFIAWFTVKGSGGMAVDKAAERLSFRLCFGYIVFKSCLHWMDISWW